MSEARMAHADVIAHLHEMIPDAHARGLDHWVEALSEVLDALEWQPMHLAPHDGTWVQVAVAANSQRPGFVCDARWVASAAPGAFRGASQKKIGELIQRYGGWWSRTKNGAPFQSAVLAWRPRASHPFPEQAA